MKNSYIIFFILVLILFCSYDFEKNKYNIDRCLVLDNELQLYLSH